MNQEHLSDVRSGQLSFITIGFNGCVELMVVFSPLVLPAVVQREIQ